MTGEILQRRRKILSITQKDLAKELCVTIACVSLWESNQRKIPKSMEKLFCLLYDYDFINVSSSLYDDVPDLPF